MTGSKATRGGSRGVGHPQSAGPDANVYVLWLIVALGTTEDTIYSPWL